MVFDDEACLKQLNPYLHSYLYDLHVSIGCVSIDEKVAIFHAIKDESIKELNESHPGSRGMVCMAQHGWWPQ